ncbi:TetR/AcrR family transcriptional regulator [Planotetraspora kaengkrachanensis]|uniref:TetR family transcriptional regulator n=1 Tax=Planotetraspora kaengkrachanensis TaxID=575193 RepID=A0A8J3LZE2_9ACTN|nr:TetR/AcrR family transcriptional regulator [Planotetraspora kaengkrachanensis]GIG80759.1 TetR family transcriptional regulator [Planotetraspora kaengkrachanensis]
MTGTTPAVPSRSDAVRNRRLLLDAAAKTFAERGVEVSIGEIAQRAGVGKGTVFRHFSSKEELLAAIMLGMLDELVGTGTALLAEGDPGRALHAFMTAGVEIFVRDRAFCEVIGRPSLQNPQVRDAIDRLCDVAEALTARAREQGVVRPDVTGTDVALLLGGIQRTAESLLSAEPQAWRRYLELAFDGITTHTGRTLPHPPPRHLPLAAPAADHGR